MLGQDRDLPVATPAGIYSKRGTGTGRCLQAVTQNEEPARVRAGTLLKMRNEQVYTPGKEVVQLGDELGQDRNFTHNVGLQTATQNEEPAHAGAGQTPTQNEE